MSWLFGRFEHQLDAKGRVILPSKIRAHFVTPDSAKAYLTPHLEGCLGLWTPEDFGPEIAKRKQDEDSGPIQRNRLRDWSSQVTETQVDRQGRLALSGELLSYAGLPTTPGTIVMIVGAVDHVELWSPERWSQRDSGEGMDGRSSVTPPSSPSAATSP